MEIIDVLVYLGALIIGIVLGLLGGGGSILTVPLLVYGLALDPVLATAYSLFVVGSSSLVGSLKHIKEENIAFKPAIAFSVPALTAVYLTRAFLIPNTPQELFQIGSIIISKDLTIMVVFAMVMLFASVAMIIGGKENLKSTPVQINYSKLIIQAALIGLVTGFVGAGGGFLIVPALVLLAGIPMKKAVASSLLIIAVNSLIGFTGDLLYLKMDWIFLLVFTALSIVGIFLGIRWSKNINANRLKKGFGYLVLIMGIFIILQELFRY